MTLRLVRSFSLSLLVAAGALLISACGTVATPEWAADAQATRVAQVSTSEYLTSIAPTNTPTNTPIPTATRIPPTNTPLPPTATPVPPTATPIPPTNTPEPTMPPAAAQGGQPSGNPEAGRVVFNQTYVTSSGGWACSLCHSVSPDGLRLIGPGLWNIAITGETRVAGQNAYDYIHTSIVAPNEYIVPADAGGPYPPGLMPQNYAEVLSEQELEDVIAYLFTLR